MSTEEPPEVGNFCVYIPGQDMLRLRQGNTSRYLKQIVEKLLLS